MTDQNGVERSRTKLTVTKRLRATLDERGIGWVAIAETATEYVQEGVVYRAYEVCGGLQVAIVTPVTPEQAIAATVGKRVTGDTSDGYHTFNELYYHRAVLFSVIVRDHSKRAWKARKHHDGTMYDGMFIVGIETSDGQATYHYDLDPY